MLKAMVAPHVGLNMGLERVEYLKTLVQIAGEVVGAELERRSMRVELRGRDGLLARPWRTRMEKPGKRQDAGTQRELETHSRCPCLRKQLDKIGRALCRE